MRYPILPAGAFLAALLVLIPACWQWRTRNVPTLSLIVWLFTLNVVYATNSLVWSDGVLDKAPVWCDISAKLIIGASTALPACALCICKYLAMIGGNRTVGLDDRGRRRITMFDFGFCWGVPITFMTLHYIVQGHRHNIVQYVGCRPTTYASILGIFIVWLPPLLLSLGTFIYAGIALYHFVQMRVVFSSVLEVSSSPMSTNRYMRLIAMSATLMLWNTIVTSLTIWENTSRGLQPWVSLKNVHSNWGHVDAYVWILMSPQSRKLTLLFWWAIPVSSVILFVFLGFGEDALKEYRRVGEVIMSTIPSRVLPGRNEQLGKGMVLVSPLPSSRLSSSKDLPPYSPYSSYVTPPVSACVTEKKYNLKEFILPLPVTMNTTSPPRATSTISISNSLGSLKPSRPTTRTRAANSEFYFHPTASYSASIHSEITQFTMSDDSLAFGQVDGPSTPLPVTTSAMNRSFQELPPIRPLQSLRSMIGLAHSRTQSPSLPKSNERRRSAKSEE